MRRVPFSIIGCGRIAERHAHHIAQLAQLIAACDVDPDARARFVAQFPGIRVYSSIHELLEEDTTSVVVSICTPNGFHASHSILALQKGKHVLCEKPMALTVHDARAMVDAALAAQRHLLIVAQNRFNPTVLRVKSLLDAGLLGKVCSAEINCFWNRPAEYYRAAAWRGTKSLGGGILFTQFCHFVDLMHWLLGDMACVTAIARNQNHKGIIEFEDTLAAIIELKSGALVTLNCTVNSYGRDMEGSIAIFAERGTVKVGGPYLNALEYEALQCCGASEVPVGSATGATGTSAPATYHASVIANVIDVLTGNARPVATSHDGLKTVEIIQAIYAQADGSSISKWAGAAVP